MSRFAEHTCRVDEGVRRPIYIRYVIDNGWDEEHPKEVIELIDLEIKRSYAEAMRIVKAQNKAHKGRWLTADVAREYQAKSWIYRVLYDYQHIKQVREIGQELQELYGVTELEAINIMNGYYVSDYVNKYYRIQHLIPLQVDAQRICDDIFSRYVEMAV